MKVACQQENLKRGLATVGHAVAGKSTLPVLSNILLATDGGRLRLAATNLEIGITCWIGARVDGDGAITVPAKLLTDVVGSLPNDTITMQLDARTQTLNLTCARFSANIKGIDADDFPAIPIVADQRPTVSLPSELICEMVDQVAFAAASDDSRPVLTGVLLRLRGNRVTLVAADGFRLAMRTVDLPESIPSPVEAIIPARALVELSRIASGSTGAVDMTVTSTGGQVLFHTENADLVSRLIDGKFPDFERIVPTSYVTRSVLDTQELAKAVKLASFFALSSANIVKLTMEPGGDLGPGKVHLSANAAEVGDHKGELDGLIQGDGGQIALDVRYFAAALNAIGTPQVALETQTPQSPGVFKPVGQEGYLHIVMPMTVR